LAEATGAASAAAAAAIEAGVPNIMVAFGAGFGATGALPNTMV
jgi:hypothetical protein